MTADDAIQGLTNQPTEEDHEYLSNRAQRFLLSSTLVRDACIYRLQVNYRRDLKSVRLYERFYSKWALGLYYIFISIDLLSILFEYPTTFYFNKTEPPYQFPLVINLICEAYFYYRWYVLNRITQKGKPLDNLSTKITIGILVLMTLDAVIYVVCQHVPSAIPVRWSRFLRPMLLLTFPENRRLREAFGSLRRTALDALPFFGFLVTIVYLVSLIGIVTLSNYKLTYPTGEPYFDKFSNAFWDMYVLATSANSPDVIIPAYERDRMFIILYIVICVFGDWLLSGILVACVYNSFRRHLGDFVVKTVAKQKTKLSEAFQLVATRTPTGERGLSSGTFMRLMRVAKPNRSEDELKVLFHILNLSRSGYLTKTEFCRLAQYVHIKLERVELSRRHFATFIPKFIALYTTPAFQTLKKVIDHPICSMFWASLTVANALTAVLLHDYPSVQLWIEWFFTIIFVLEISLKYVVCGGVSYLSDVWNRFDCAIVLIALCSQIIQGILDLMGVHLPVGITQMLLLLRQIRLLKLLSAVNEFRVIIGTIFTIGQSLVTYVAVILILYYVFTCFAVEVFSYNYEPPALNNYTENFACFHPLLKGTNFVKWHYCLFNFNSAAESFLTLFALTVENSWHMIGDGTIRTSLNPSRIFFGLVHWVCVVLTLNVVLAFIIEAYSIQHQTPTGEFERYIRSRLQELGMDAQTELRKRGLMNYGQAGFYMTYKELNAAFPPNSPTVTAFLLKNDIVPVDVLMFRMFQREVEDLVERHKIQEFGDGTR